MEALVVIFALAVLAFGLYLLARRRRSIAPDDPDAGVPVKVNTRPGSKSGAAAVAEPDEDETI